MDMMKLAEEIIAGRRLGREDDLSVLVHCDLKALAQGADQIRRHLLGEKVDLCTIINGRSGHCPEDCKYCAQSVHHATGCAAHDLLEKEVIVQEARQNEEEGVDRFAIVTSGMGFTPADFDQLLAADQSIRTACHHLKLCGSHGFLTREQFRRLRQAGVSRYHENIETSRRFFPSICTTHTYDDKIRSIRMAQEEGLSVCSGGIIGMGETWEDRLDMAVSLSELGIESIPINALMPISGTPLEALPQLPQEDILRTVAIFRYLNPEANIRLAAGRALIDHDGEAAFAGGASAAITGNMLTTSGSTIQSDRAMLQAMGRRLAAPVPKEK